MSDTLETVGNVLLRTKNNSIGVQAVEVIGTMQALGWLSPDQLTARDAEVTRMALEMARNQVRHDCTVCNGSGHADADSECEYCGRPMQAIRALQPAPTEWVMVPEGSVVLSADCTRGLLRAIGAHFCGTMIDDGDMQVALHEIEKALPPASRKI